MKNWNIFRRWSVLGSVVGALVLSVGSAGAVDFQLLTWGSDEPALPTAVGRKPSASAPTAGDWLIFTSDDGQPGAAYNPQGALSHNLADLSGAGGSGFNMAPSLTGTLSLDISGPSANQWDVHVTGLAYSGQATPVMFMNQFLVSSSDPAAQNPAYGVDGNGNSGTWKAESADSWAISYDLDYYFATNADGDPSSADVDLTFADQRQQGYLLPVPLLNSTDLMSMTLEDPAGFYGGDFAQYLVDEVAPRLPAEATYLLFTQQDKARPNYAETGLPVTTNSLIGNTTFAYTTASTIPEPGSAMLLLLAAGLLLGARRVPVR